MEAVSTEQKSGPVQLIVSPYPVTLCGVLGWEAPVSVQTQCTGLVEGDWEKGANIMHEWRNRILSLCIAMAIVLAVIIGSQGLDRVSAVDREDYEGLESFSNVLAIVQKNYVKDVKTNELVEGAINGMLGALDPHSAYLTPDSYRELQVDTEGSFGGLGIEITLRDDILTVVSPIEDTPAFRSGVKAGDQIVKIDGELTKDMSLIAAVKKMRGPTGQRSDYFGPP